MMSEQGVRPRLDPSTRLDEMVLCVRTIYKSDAGAVRQGVILRSDDPRVRLVPDCFVELATRTDALFPPTDDPFDNR
jgi:hypothetical protein